MSKLNSIRDSINVITGCGSGLGKATLEWFLNKGSGPILGIDRLFEDGYEESLDIREEHRKKLVLRKQDTFSEDIDQCLGEFVSQHKRIDNLVNVAGVALAFALYWKNSGHIYDIEHMKNLLKFNTYGTFNMSRLASKYMIENSTNSQFKTKCIINASCISTTSPSMGQSAYAGSKSAIDATTLCLARELSPFNIRCNTINVGFFDTRLIRASEEMVASLLCDSSLAPKRLGHGSEFAHLVQTIIENEMLNGACIRLDAGARQIL